MDHGLDEYAIADLVAASAPIDAHGVGTKIGVSANAPYLDTAFGLVDYVGRPVMKLSAGEDDAAGIQAGLPRPGRRRRRPAR